MHDSSETDFKQECLILVHSHLISIRNHIRYNSSENSSLSWRKFIKMRVIMTFNRQKRSEKLFWVWTSKMLKRRWRLRNMTMKKKRNHWLFIYFQEVTDLLDFTMKLVDNWSREFVTKVNTIKKAFNILSANVLIIDQGNLNIYHL